MAVALPVRFALFRIGAGRIRCGGHCCMTRGISWNRFYSTAPTLLALSRACNRGPAPSMAAANRAAIQAVERHQHGYDRTQINPAIALNVM